MTNETLNLLFEIIDEKYKSIRNTLANDYDKIIDKLNEIVNNQFPDLNNGRLIVFPAGDYLTNTYYDNSILDFYIIYQTSKDNVNFSVVYETKTKKGKKKVSTYRQIMGSAVNKGTLQAEDIAERIAFYMQQTITGNQRLFQKRNQIYFSLPQGLRARINVVYDFIEEKNDDLKMRRVNQWTDINLLKYFSDIDKKDVDTNHKYTKFVKLFKLMELELLIANETNLFIGKNGFVENLLYNVPNELFKFDDDIVLNNILNYLKQKEFENYVLIDETGKMFDDNLVYTKNYAKQFINKIIYANNNFEKILEITLNRDED